VKNKTFNTTRKKNLIDQRNLIAHTKINFGATIHGRLGI